MLRDEKRGISGNGQESFKHAKFYKGKEEKRGGGKREKCLDDQANSEAKSQEKCVWFSMVHYPWEGKELRKAQPGGLGIIPIEDQFKAISTNTGEEYISFKFLEKPKFEIHQNGVEVVGLGTDKAEQILKVKLSEGDAILECTYDCFTIIWVNRKWVKKN